MQRLEYPTLRETVYSHKLPNGLRVIVIKRAEYSKQFAFFATRYGGMDLRFQGGDGGGWVDTPAGIAHFLEHKMFDTEDGSALEILAANGAVDNAFTAAHITGYFFEGTQGFEEKLRTLLGFVSVPYFTRESVAKEQGIIAQEIRMCEDDPENVVYYQLLESMYAHNPIRNPVVGTVESIAGLTPEILYECHRAFYRPGNMVLCVAGDVDPEGVAAAAEEILPREFSSAVRVDLGQPEPKGVVRSYVQRRMPVAAPLFEVGFKGEPAPEGSRLRQELVAQLTCDVLLGPSAPLYRKLYEQGLINGSFDGFYDAAPGCAHIMAGGESRDPHRVMEEIVKEAQRLVEGGVDGQLWDRLKRAAYGSVVRRLNSLENTCIDLAQSYFEGDDYLRFPELFQSIEREDVQRLLERWCTQERASLSVILPVDGMSE